MQAPITNAQLLELMWERFPELMTRGAIQQKQHTVAEVVLSDHEHPRPYVHWYEDDKDFYERYPVGTKFMLQSVPQ